MIRTRLFRNHFLFLTGILLGFAVLGTLTTHFIIRFADNHTRPPSLVTFFAHSLENVSPDARAKQLLQMEQWNKESVFRFLLVNANGDVLYPKDKKLFLDWNQIKKPELAYEVTPLHNEPKHLFGPPAPFAEIIRLSGSTPQYLIANFDHDKKRPLPAIPVFALSFGSLFISIFLGVGVALFFIFRAIQQKVHLADSVISELQNGNLKARFQIKKMDEMGQAMSRFNKMAEEIERLVEQLKSAEQSRMILLQELAHDLRTPVASLKHLVETVHEDHKTLEPHLLEELMTLAIKEIDYFERLVEDLLVLAQVNEPRYNANKLPVIINHILEEEIDAVTSHYQSIGKNISVIKEFTETEIKIIGDPHLLRRMLRNALENAFSFAKTKTAILLKVLPNHEMMLMITEDGPGFSDIALKAFGERRVSRQLGSGEKNGRISVGLGSVIIKTVAHLHRGSISVGNLYQNEIVSGAQLTIKLPIS